VWTTHYANNDKATRTAPTSVAPVLRGSFDLANGGQLSTLLSAQERIQNAVIIGNNPYEH
jgi:hypothetical protein